MTQEKKEEIFDESFRVQAVKQVRKRISLHVQGGERFISVENHDNQTSFIFGMWESAWPSFRDEVDSLLSCPPEEDARAYISPCACRQVDEIEEEPIV